MGPLCFDYGFGPFDGYVHQTIKRTLKKQTILHVKFEEMLKASPDEIKLQLQDNITGLNLLKRINL